MKIFRIIFIFNYHAIITSSVNFVIQCKVLVMMYLVLEVQSTAHVDECSKLNAWVNVRSHGDAIGILSEELSLQGWALTNVLESTTTEESDYFPPCDALDAFKEARSNLLALRFC